MAGLKGEEVQLVEERTANERGQGTTDEQGKEKTRTVSIKKTARCLAKGVLHTGRSLREKAIW